MKNLLHALILSILLIGCGAPKPNKPATATTETAATSEAAPTSNTLSATEEPTSATKSQLAFAPELLLSDRQTMGLTIEIPQVRTLLTKSPGNFVRVTLIVECASEAAKKEAEEKLPKLSGAVSESLSGKTAEFVESVEGKLKLKEEIIWRMQRMMQNKGIKQVYYQEFSVEKP